jgi:hypothetical protein
VCLPFCPFLHDGTPLFVGRQSPFHILHLATNLQTKLAGGFIVRENF